MKLEFFLKPSFPGDLNVDPVHVCVTAISLVHQVLPATSAVPKCRVIKGLNFFPGLYHLRLELVIPSADIFILQRWRPKRIVFEICPHKWSGKRHKAVRKSKNRSGEIDYLEQNPRKRCVRCRCTEDVAPLKLFE